MARPRKPRNNCQTVDDVRQEKAQKETARRQKIRSGMLAWRRDERALQEACMSTQEMRDLEAIEEMFWALLGGLNKDDK